jgi:hypothetical protein
MNKSSEKETITLATRQQLITFKDALKSYSAVIQGVGRDEKLLKKILGLKDYRLLMKVGLTDFCYQKAEEFLKKFPPPKLPIESLKNLSPKTLKDLTGLRWTPPSKAELRHRETIDYLRKLAKEIEQIRIK